MRRKTPNIYVVVSDYQKFPIAQKLKFHLNELDFLENYKFQRN